MLWPSFTNTSAVYAASVYASLVIAPAASSFCVVFIKPDTHQAISAYSALKRNYCACKRTMGPHISIMDLPTGKRKRKLKFSDVHEVTTNLNILQCIPFICTFIHLADDFIKSSCF